MDETRIELIETTVDGWYRTQVVLMLADFVHPAKEVSQEAAKDFCKTLDRVQGKWDDFLNLKRKG